LAVLSGAGLAAHLTSVVTRRQFSKLKTQEPGEPASGEQKGKE